MTHAPAPAPSETWRHRAWQAVRLTVRRDPSLGLLAFVVYSVLWLGCVGYVATLASAPGALDLRLVAMAAVLGLVGQGMMVRIGPRVELDCGEVFWVTSLVVLAPREAAVAGLIGLLFTSWHGTTSLEGLPRYGCFFGVPFVATAALVQVLPDVGAGQPTLLALTLLAAFACWRVGDLSFYVVTGFIEERAGLRGRLAAMRRDARTVPWAETGVQVAAQAPTALLGVMAYQVAPWAPVLMLLPYLVAWRSLRQEQRLAEAHRLMGIDSLTGIANRGRFFERAEVELASARRYRHPVALIMGDLDNFKRVNDTLGHLAGDEVLRTTARALQAVASDELFPLARYGGEEFVVVAPALSREQALELSERIRAAVERDLAEWDATISLGVAYLREGDRLESLIDRADKALYSAKYAGKNRVHEWPGDGVERPISSPLAA